MREGVTYRSFQTARRLSLAPILKDFRNHFEQAGHGVAIEEGARRVLLTVIPKKGSDYPRVELALLRGPGKLEIQLDRDKNLSWDQRALEAASRVGAAVGIRRKGGKAAKEDNIEIASLSNSNVRGTKYGVLQNEACTVLELSIQRHAWDAPADAPRKNFCTSCGAPLKEGAAFCEACGAKVASLTAGRVCPHCGTELPEQAWFCPACGYEFVAASPEARMASSGADAALEESNSLAAEPVGQEPEELVADEPEELAAEEPEEPAEEPQELPPDATPQIPAAHESEKPAPEPERFVLFCGECGTRLPAEALFCPSCGTAVPLGP